ncbi:MAG TPA: uracil-DNA glycosylase [Chromatiaceae bacterium]|nr:uracil-DNA glycosylase [Chromatiaceae bacterium]
MDARRQAYLDAMGIQTWAPRASIAVSTESPPPVAAGSVGAEPLARVPVEQLDWDALRAEVAACQRCALAETRTQTVFGVGDPRADLLIVGEAPGADEDRLGEPFVGRAGQLLNLMLQAIGLRREQVYIANILKCRPPGNRDPRAEEAAHCRPFLLRQIALIEPRLILSVGRISAQNLLHSDEAVGRLRGRVHRFPETDTPLIVTYHPAYLLRSPEQKAKAWDDLQRVHRILHGRDA